MRIQKWSGAALASCLALAAGTGQASQDVSPTGSAVRFVAPSGQIAFTAKYNVAAPTTRNSTGLGLCLHWDSTKVGTFAVTNILDETPPGSSNYSAQPPTHDWQNDPTVALPPGSPSPNSSSCGAAGGSTITPGTDTQFVQAWVGVGGTWPGGTAVTVPFPVSLYDVTFNAAANFSGVTTIGFSATSTSNSTTFTHTDITVCAMPTVTVSKVQDGSETGPTDVVLRVTLSSAIPAACGVGGVFPVALTLGGSATNGTDYTITTGGPIALAASTVTVNFPADGATVQEDVHAVVNDDSLIEGVETVTLTAAAGSGNYAGVGNSVSANIADNDPTATITAASSTVPDNGTSTTLTISIGAATAPVGGVSVPLTLPGANSRFSTTCTNPMVVPAGQSIVTCTVTGTANVVANDGNVPLAFTINCSGTCTTGNPSTANVTIIDDDIPVITAAASSTTLTDSASQVSTITVSTTIQSASPLSINFTPPTADARYTLTNCTSPVVLPANTSSVAACTVTAVANTTLGDGSSPAATLTVLSGSGYNVGSPASASVTVNNDDFASISVSVAPSSVAENSGTPLVFTFTASAANPNSTTAISFTPPPNSGRYTNGCATSPIILPINATTVSCSVTPLDNTSLDGPISATVTLVANAALYTLDPTPANRTATGTITDNEIGVSVLATTGDVIEGGTLVFTISCSGQGSTTVNYAFSGTYTPLPADSSTTVTCGTPVLIQVPTFDDSIINGQRTVIMSISIPQVSPLVVDPAHASATGFVEDNDRPTVIPTMNNLGLLLMGLLLAAAAAFGIRRKA